MQCPKCVRLRTGLVERAPGWCSRCRRWQFLFQAEYAYFALAKFSHLRCVNCASGAWCRDMWMRPSAGKCAKEGHVENFDAHPGGESVPPARR